MSDYINELNESQRAAVLYNDGPSLVIAGAGSGKTRVLTYKIAWLLENGYQPWNILAEQGGTRDEDAHRTAGGFRTGALVVDGNFPQPLPAHPARRGRCAGLHASVHHL